MPGIPNNELNIDACVRFSQWLNVDVSASNPANRLPLLCDTQHDIYVVGIESYVTAQGDTNGADVVLSIGSAGDNDLVGTLTIAKAATPATGAAEAGTLNSATRSTVEEARGGVLVPKGTPILTYYTNSGTNVAERAVRISYVLVDENFHD